MYEKIARLPVLSKFLPVDAVMTVDRDAAGKPIRYTVDAKTESTLQWQRAFAMTVGGPTVVYAGWKADVGIPMKIFIMSLGVACSMSHFHQFKTVYKASRV